MYTNEKHEATLPVNLQAVLPLELKDKAMLIMNSLPVAQSFPLGSEARTAIIEAYSDTFRNIILIGIVIQAIALVICFAIRNVSVDKDTETDTQAVN
jgi:D-mannonate dehydratase